jgi:pSer/pThr/pTyr-binding forkhead associated (FHA) protein
MSRLSIYRDETLVSEVVLMRASVALGRHPDNDVVLDDRTLSRFHARVERRGDRHFVVDLNAQNGIYLNGARIMGATALAPGDRIVFGKYVAIFDGDATTPSKRRGSGGRSVDSESADDPPTPDRGLKTDIINPRAVLRGTEHERLGEEIAIHGEESAEPTRTEVGAKREETVEVLGHVSEALKLSEDPTTKLLPKSFTKPEPVVVLLFNGLEVSRHTIGAGVVIGRSKGCDVVISLLGLSRRHTRIEKRATDLFVVDLESQNGTWVNNTRVDRERRLAHGDLLNFYEYGVLYLEDPNAEISLPASGFTPPLDATHDVLARQETGQRGPQTNPVSPARVGTMRTPPPKGRVGSSDESNPRGQPLDELGLGDGAHFPDDAGFDDEISGAEKAAASVEPAGGGTAISDDLDASLISSDLDDELIAELDEFTADPTTASRVPGRDAALDKGKKNRSWVSDADLEAALVRRADKRVRRLEVYLDDQLYTQVPLTQQVTRIGTDARCELALPKTAGLAAWQVTIITFPAATLLYRASANARVRVEDDDIDHVLLKDGDTIVLGRVRIQYHLR